MSEMSTQIPKNARSITYTFRPGTDIKKKAEEIKRVATVAEVDVLNRKIKVSFSNPKACPTCGSYSRNKKVINEHIRSCWYANK